MDESTRERFLSGELSPQELLTWQDDLGDDRALAGELQDLAAQARLLEILIEDPEGQRSLEESIRSAVAKERASQGEDDLPASSGGTWWRVAAVLVGSLSAGLLSGSLIPKKTDIATSTGGGQFRSLLPNRASTGQDGPLEKAAPMPQWEAFARLEGVSPEDFPNLYATIHENVRGSRRAESLSLLIYRWADLAPLEALDFLTRQGRSSELSMLFQAWTARDALAAWEAAKMLQGNGRRTALTSILNHLSKHDPEQFLAWAAEEPHAASESAWKTATGELASAEDAYEVVRQLEGNSRAAALQGLAQRQAENHPEMAVAWAEDLAEKHDQDVALAAVLTTVGATNPTRAGQVLRRYPGRFPQVERAIAKQLGRQDPDAALDWIQEYSSAETKAMLYRDVVLDVGLRSDNEVFEMLERLEEDEGVAVFRKDHRLDDIFWKTQGLDYQRGMEWVANLPDETYGKRYMLPSMIFAWAKEDMQAAIDYVGALEESNLQERLNSSIVSNMISSSSDLEMAWEFATSLPSTDIHDRDRFRVLQRYARRDPENAATRIDAIPEGQYRDMAVAEVAQNWGRISPGEAVHWADSLETMESQRLAYANIAEHWSAYDSMQASQWIAELDSGVLRDTAVDQLVKNVAPFEGDSAFAWASTMETASLRAEAMEFAVREWARQDLEAVQSKVNTLGLSERQRYSQIIHQTTIEK